MATEHASRRQDLLFRAYQNANLWLDDVRYANDGLPDTDQPAVPTGVTATMVDGLVEVSWTSNTAPDLLGYNVYCDGANWTPGASGFDEHLLRRPRAGHPLVPGQCGRYERARERPFGCRHGHRALDPSLPAACHDRGGERGDGVGAVAVR